MSIDSKSRTDQSITAKADAAFRIASQDVVREAEQFKTEVVIWQDGKVVKLTAEEAAKLLETTPE